MQKRGKKVSLKMRTDLIPFLEQLGYLELVTDSLRRTGRELLRKDYWSLTDLRKVEEVRHLVDLYIRWKREQEEERR